jgi:hypothetical protein
MGKIKISGLPAATSIDPTDLVMLVHVSDSTTRKTTVAELVNAVPSSTAAIEKTYQSTAKWEDSANTDPSATATGAGIRMRRRRVQTTTATANQVLDDGGTFGGEDFTLPDNAVTRIEVTLLVKKNATGAGGTIKAEADYYRAGGPPTLIGSLTITYNLTGVSLDGTTINFNVNGNKVEVRGSPESADTLNWRIFRTQYEGVD